MNLYQLLGDMSHLAAMVLLPYKLHTSRSAAGVSLKMQELYLLVFVTRYLDLFYTFYSWYNCSMKIVFIILTALTIGMLKCRPSLKASYDRSLDRFRLWMHGIIPSFALAVIVQMRQTENPLSHMPRLVRFAWTFSQVLEPLAVVPQLLVFRGSTDAGRLGWVYVFLMGAYRVLYIPNWMYKARSSLYRHIPLVYAAAAVQTGMYLMFVVDRRFRASPHQPPLEIGDLDIDIMEQTSSARERLLPAQASYHHRERGMDSEMHGSDVSSVRSVDCPGNVSRRGRQEDNTANKIESVLLRERVASSSTEAAADAQGLAACTPDGDKRVGGGVFLV